jgi:hypothetical protein
MRPTFLTVLCILTFVGSSYTIISSLLGGITSKASNQILNESKREIDSLSKNASTPEEKRAMKMVSKFTEGLDPEKLQKSNWAQAVASVFCILGAFLMWKLKRIGFYAYILGTLIGVVAPFVILGTSNIIAILSATFIAFIGIVFCILYGLNYKHLK